MNRQKKDLEGNFGAGGFSDQYDNQKFRSLDDNGNPGGVTGIQFEDDFDAARIGEDLKGEAFYYPGKRSEPSRDADLGRGRSGTSWNRFENKNYSGMGPKGWELSDEKLQTRVCEVLLHSHDVDPTELEITVKDKVVYVKGHIQSKGMRIVCEDLILSIPGVEDVFTDVIISNTQNFQINNSESKTE